MGRGAGRRLGFPNAAAFTDRHGKVRWRFRKKGLAAVYLPGLPGSAEFAAAYAAATLGQTTKLQPGAARTQPGTLHALAVEIYASAEWAQLSTATQTTYRGILEGLRDRYGELLIAGLTRDRVLRMRDKKRDHPTAANNLVKVLRWALAFAVARRLLRENPTDGIKPLKVATDGFHTWTEDEIAAFEARWPVGTRERLAFDLLLHTAQRSGDVRQMGRQSLRNGVLKVRQEKTGAELELPLHTALRASLATVPANQMLFLQTAKGEAFTAAGFGNWFKDACRDAGVGHCSAHGLRKSAATRLADAGCTESQIMAFTGHATSKEVRRYTAKRDQRRLAAAALQQVAGAKEEQTLANPADRLAKSPRKSLKGKGA
ncbi:MAG TPA: tyrosine-type recombinase/integrase [Brevundimonas sp.]|jgi:integrase|uniref:tyrosine-type recombinase/integrase n=1 Tax=Brevundimonas sp. TaxID=1871086 RepID=UPI002DF21159|nr:tyrosine-type recombinase/integrase [Brevundimonas sp.]